MQINSIDDLLEQNFGVRVEVIEEPTALDADIAVKAFVPRNRRRIALVLINLSANNVTVAPFKDVSLTRGIRLATNGGSLAMSWKDDLILPSMEWSGLADAENSAVYALGAYIATGRTGESST